MADFLAYAWRIFWEQVGAPFLIFVVIPALIILPMLALFELLGWLRGVR
jgi:hypothetical protein